MNETTNEQQVQRVQEILQDHGPALGEAIDQTISAYIREHNLFRIGEDGSVFVEHSMKVGISTILIRIAVSGVWDTLVGVKQWAQQTAGEAADILEEVIKQNQEGPGQ